MAILLTGGAGFIGSHTAVELLQAGHEVVIADMLFNAKRSVIDRIEQITGKTVSFYKADVTDESVLRKIFRENTIDTVVHFAGLKAVGESVENPIMYYRNNLNAALSVLNVMKEYGCHRFIFSSSATVYGFRNPMPLKETMPLGECTNPYGWTKWFIEQILRDTATSDPDFSCVLLRYFNPIGAHPSGLIGEDPSYPANVFPYITQVAVGRRPELVICGNDYNTKDGTCVRDYIHVVDLAKGHVAAVQYTEEHSGLETVNLGTGNGISLLELVDTFERVNNIKLPHRFGPRRPGDVDICYANADKAYELLGWKTEYTLEDMCRDGYRWQIQNPNGYPD